MQFLLHLSKKTRRNLWTPCTNLLCLHMATCSLMRCFDGRMKVLAPSIRSNSTILEEEEEKSKETRRLNLLNGNLLVSRLLHCCPSHSTILSFREPGSLRLILVLGESEQAVFLQLHLMDEQDVYIGSKCKNLVEIFSE